MNVPFLDLKAQYADISGEIEEALRKVLASSAYSSGPFVESFEKDYARFCGVGYCIGMNSGTSALHAALLALGIGPGDEVIAPAHSFIATHWAISYTGAVPVFADIDERTYTLDPEKAAERITPKTKAIIPVHLYGQTADMDAFRKLTKDHDLFLVEDAAQAHGAEYKGKKAGGLADIAEFSFYPGKNLGAYGEGGAVTTDNGDLAEKCRLLRNHCQPEKYIHTDIGYNYRMDGLQGAILETKLRYLDEWTEKRRSVAKRYTEAFGGRENIIPPYEAQYSKHVYHLYELKLGSLSERDGLQSFLAESGIQSGLHYPIPVHLQQAYASLGYAKGDFPVTENAADTLLSLPVYPEMTSGMVDRVIEKVVEFADK